MPHAPLPASILVALGLTGCAADPLAPPTAGPARRASLQTTPAGTGQTGDTSETGDSGTVSPCLVAPPQDTGKYQVCLCACDGADGAGGSLLLPGLAALAAHRRSRREVLDALAASGVLPSDVAERNRARRP